MRFDVLSLGPARMDVFVKLPEEITEWCSIDKKRCMIELGFGEKIAVKTVNYAVGGNTGNNAVGVTRLGLKAAMLGGMGDGWGDKEALEILKKEGVDTTRVQVIPGKSGFGVVINYQEERTILSYYADTNVQIPEDLDVEAEWMYLTTAGETYEDFYSQAVQLAAKKNIKIAFNPGSRQLKAGIEKLKYVYEACEILFVNKEEAAMLISGDVGNVRALLNGLHNLGPKTVVITDGPAGTYAYDGTKYWHMPIVPAPVIERTGAGDAFGSGFLSATIKGKLLPEALRWGTVNSASVLGFIGPQAGLLSEKGIQEWLEKSSSVVAEEI
ncbi:MAG: carbohydrate kinase family protein [Patescibacteria group bacterium]